MASKIRFKVHNTPIKPKKTKKFEKKPAADERVPPKVEKRGRKR